MVVLFRRLAAVLILAAALLGGHTATAHAWCSGRADPPDGYPNTTRANGYLQCYENNGARDRAHVWVGIEGYTGGGNGSWVVARENDEGVWDINNWPGWMWFGPHWVCPVWGNQTRSFIRWNNLTTGTVGNRAVSGAVYRC
jgi:hypothetical protein